MRAAKIGEPCRSTARPQGHRQTGIERVVVAGSPVMRDVRAREKLCMPNEIFRSRLPCLMMPAFWNERERMGGAGLLLRAWIGSGESALFFPLLFVRVGCKWYWLVKVSALGKEK